LDAVGHHRPDGWLHLRENTGGQRKVHYDVATSQQVFRLASILQIPGPAFDPKPAKKSPGQIRSANRHGADIRPLPQVEACFRTNLAVRPDDRD
jgi:hypothetical protein